MNSTLVAAAALIGTLLQMVEAMRSLRDSPDADTFRAVDHLKTVMPPRRHLRARRDHRRTLRNLRQQHPQEWAAYRRMWLVLISWSMLTVAAAGAVLDTIL